jgi:hypothetical protein
VDIGDELDPHPDPCYRRTSRTLAGMAAGASVVVVGGGVMGWNVMGWKWKAIEQPLPVRRGL